MGNILIEVLVPILTAFLSYLGARLQSKNDLQKAREQYQADLQKVKEQAQADLQKLKEQAQAEIEKERQNTENEIKLMKTEMENYEQKQQIDLVSNIMGGEKMKNIFETMLDSDQITKIMESAWQDNGRK